jgi:hypothetical protein
MTARSSTPSRARSTPGPLPLWSPRSARPDHRRCPELQALPAPRQSPRLVQHAALADNLRRRGAAGLGPAGRRGRPGVAPRARAGRALRPRARSEAARVRRARRRGARARAASSPHRPSAASLRPRHRARSAEGGRSEPCLTSRRAPARAGSRREHLYAGPALPTAKVATERGDQGEREPATDLRARPRARGRPAAVGALLGPLDAAIRGCVDSVRAVPCVCGRTRVRDRACVCGRARVGCASAAIDPHAGVGGRSSSVRGRPGKERNGVHVLEHPVVRQHRPCIAAVAAVRKGGGAVADGRAREREGGRPRSRGFPASTRRRGPSPGRGTRRGTPPDCRPAARRRLRSPRVRARAARRGLRAQQRAEAGGRVGGPHDASCPSAVALVWRGCRSTLGGAAPGALADLGESRRARLLVGAPRRSRAASSFTPRSRQMPLARLAAMSSVVTNPIAPWTRTEPWWRTSVSTTSRASSRDAGSRTRRARSANLSLHEWLRIQARVNRARAHVLSAKHSSWQPTERAISAGLARAVGPGRRLHPTHRGAHRSTALARDAGSRGRSERRSGPPRASLGQRGGPRPRQSRPASRCSSASTSQRPAS